MVKNPPANAGDARDSGSIPGSGGPPGRDKSDMTEHLSTAAAGHRL